MALKESHITILGIETSCDETAAAVVTDGRQVRSSVVASQTALHQKYGGVVPEIASRAHIENLLPVLTEAMNQAGVGRDDIDAVAIANQPGLAIALIVGVTAAKTLSMMWGKPLVAINHLHAHLQSAMLNEERIELPAVALVVSGGHTSLYDCESALDLTLLGSTIDDAAGEAFDKVATILKLPYPGGPSIEKAARNGDPKAIRFPRSMLGRDSLDFSFSGLKTAVLYHCRGQDMKGADCVDRMSEQQIADIAASFQAAVIDVLVRKTKRAADRIGARTVLLGGGVAANSSLRRALAARGDLDVRFPPLRLCGDNGAMVAGLGSRYLERGESSGFDLNVSARVSLYKRR